MTRRTLWLVGLGAALAVALPLAAQRGWGRGGDFESRIMPNIPYDGRFTFARIRYAGFGGLGPEGPGWMHDYPWAEQNMMQIMQELTTLRPYRDGGNIFTPDDPELMKFPVAYLSEPGYWQMSRAEQEGMRNYLLKGGMLIIDDFQQPRDAWYVLEDQFRRVLPEARWMPIPPEHPVFDTFFGVVEPERVLQVPIQFYGLYEENDPAKRLMVIANFNADLGENWQHSASGWYPVDMSNEAYKLGVNYFIYGLTR